MNKPIGSTAHIPNPALKALERLVGEWSTVGTHPLVTGEIHGRTSFEWADGGAFLKQRSEVTDDERFPSGIAYIGSDDALGQMQMLYFDSRGVSRIQQFAMEGNQWRWWRDDPNFRQRVTGTISDDGQTMTARGEMCRDGSNWESDLSLTYTRL